MTQLWDPNQQLQDGGGGLSSHLINPSVGISLYFPSWQKTHTWIRPCAAADPNRPGFVLPPSYTDPNTNQVIVPWRATLPPVARGVGINKKITFIDKCRDRPDGTTPFQRCREWALSAVRRDKNFEVFTKGSKGAGGYLGKPQSIFLIQGWMYVHKDSQMNPPRYVAFALPHSASTALQTLSATTPDLVSPAGGKLLDIFEASKLAGGGTTLPGMTAPGMNMTGALPQSADMDRSRYEVIVKQDMAVAEGLMAASFIPFQNLVRFLTMQEMVVAICDAFSDTAENMAWLPHFFRDSEFESMVPDVIRERYFVSRNVGFVAQPGAGYGQPPVPGGGYGAPAAPAYGQPPGGYGAPQAPTYGQPLAAGFGAPPAGAPVGQGYGAFPQAQAPVYNLPTQGYGAPPAGAPPYGAPPAGAPTYGTPPLPMANPPSSPPVGMPPMQPTPPAAPVAPPAPAAPQAPQQPGYGPPPPAQNYYGAPPAAPQAPQAPQGYGAPPTQEYAQQPQAAPTLGMPQAGPPTHHVQQQGPPVWNGGNYQPPSAPVQQMPQGGPPPAPPGMNNPGMADSQARLNSVLQATQQYAAGQQPPGPPPGTQTPQG